MLVLCDTVSHIFTPKIMLIIIARHVTTQAILIKGSVRVVLISNSEKLTKSINAHIHLE